jgi:branched-chain amino acid transport system ATP-binding protein
MNSFGVAVVIEPILEVRNLVKRFGALLATDNLSLTVLPSELHAVIGPNGAGKTTLIAQLSGELRPTEGRILLSGEDVTDMPVSERAQRGIATSFQITSLCPDFSALQNVALAVQAQQGHSFRMWGRSSDNEDINGPAREFLAKVGLRTRANVLAGSLAHGEQRQLEVAVALACRPRVLLLDEPMAGMGREESWAMMRLLKTLKGQHSILLVEHDMAVVFALADRITVLVYGRPIASGSPREISARADVRDAYLGERETLDA